MKEQLFYGLANKQEAVIITRKICDILGRGSNNNADQLLIETAQKETLLGSFRDRHPHKHGVGLSQFDLIGFNDVKQRTRPHIAAKIYENFGIKLRHIEHRDLAFSPFLSLLWCRLFYMLIPEPIPTNIPLRADYWKKYYNTVKGAGTAQEYITCAKEIPVMY